MTSHERARQLINKHRNCLTCHSFEEISSQMRIERELRHCCNPEHRDDCSGGRETCKGAYTREQLIGFGLASA